MKLSDKHRPKNIDELYGQTQKVALTRLLENTSKTVLISGASGTGKTTIARLYASHLLNVPMSELDTTIGFTSVNCRELNIGFVRDQLLPSISTPSIMSDYSFWLMDEAHMISDAIWGVLLTYLEDLPEHVVMVFTTTNPAKTLKTGKDTAVKSRLNPHFRLQEPSPTQQKKLMMEIFSSCGIEVGDEDTQTTISPDTAREIYNASGGNMRQLLDNIDAYSGGYFTSEGREAKNSSLANTLLTGNRNEIIEAAGKVVNHQSEIYGICNYMIAVLKNTQNPRALTALKIFGTGLSLNLDEITFYMLLFSYLEEK